VRRRFVDYRRTVDGLLEPRTEAGQIVPAAAVGTLRRSVRFLAAKQSHMAKKDIIVIGGSAGSHSPLRQIISELPADLPASIFIATHVPTHSSGYLSDVLEMTSRLRVTRAIDGQPIERGCVYVAVPDHHLLVIDGTVRLGSGPRENMTRPAIDPLFRSAALSYGPRVVGVILSGMLNDGASGLSAVKACGGTAIVQHPLDATADQMPLSALQVGEPDCVAAASDLAGVIARTVKEEAGEAVRCPESLELEVDIAAGRRLGADRLREIADPSALSCPDCQGVLSEVRGEQPLRYRCQIGHASTAEILDSRAEQVDEAMRIALRVMEERVTLVTRMAEDARRTGRNTVAELYESRAEEYTRYATVLRQAAVASLRDNRSAPEVG
jgi:two-component system chemotaxis response regulator CheB